MDGPWGWRHVNCAGTDIVAARAAAAAENDRKQRATSSARAARRYTSGGGVEVVAANGDRERQAPYKREDIRPLVHAVALAERLQRKTSAQPQEPAVD